jgi:hypothetical protein
LKEALEVAVMNQVNDSDSRASEAVSKLASSLVQVLAAITTLSKIESDKELKLHEMNKTGKEPTTTVNIQNNLILSTSELIDQILNKTKKLT